MKFILLFLIAAPIVGFGQKEKQKQIVGFYGAFLDDVEPPKDYKKGIIDTTASSYEDYIINIKWEYTGVQMEFDLKNKSGETIKVIWDDAAFISLTGESQKIFHKGIKYIDKSNHQPPTPIYKNTSLSDLISPSDYAYMGSDGWKSKPLFPREVNIWKGGQIYNPDLIGQQFRVVLPIMLSDGKTLEYLFVFKVNFKEKESKKKN